MFKALKGKAAGALEAASATVAGSGDPNALKELESKLKAAEKELEKKGKALDTVGARMKKFEETEQRIMGDVQKKDAEISRQGKLLEKYKKEGAGASAVLEEAMKEMREELDGANRRVGEMEESGGRARVELEEAKKGMEDSEGEEDARQKRDAVSVSVSVLSAPGQPFLLSSFKLNSN